MWRPHAFRNAGHSQGLGDLIPTERPLTRTFITLSKNRHDPVMQTKESEKAPGAVPGFTLAGKGQDIAQEDGTDSMTGEEVEMAVLSGEELVQCIQALEALLEEAPSWVAPKNPEEARVWLTEKRQELVQLSVSSSNRPHSVILPLA